MNTENTAKIKLKKGVNNLKNEFCDSLYFSGTEKHIFYRCVILCLLISLSIVWAPFAYVALGVGLIFVLLERDIKSFYYLVLLLPFYNIFRYDPTQLFFSIWLLLAFVGKTAVRLVIDLIKKRKKINWVITIATAVVGVYLLLPIGPFNFNNLLPIGVVLVASYLIFYYKDELNFKNLTLFLFYGVLFAFIVSLFIDVSPRLQLFVQRFTNYSVTTFRYQSLSRDPNYFALEILLLIACFMKLFLTNKIGYLFYPVVFFLACLGITSDSKSYLIVYLVCILCFVLLYILRFKKSKKLFLSLAGIILALLLPFLACYKHTVFLYDRITNQGYYGNIESDYQIEGSKDNSGNTTGGSVEGGDNTSGNTSEIEDKLKDITTGRSQIWKIYIKEYTKDFKTMVFGVGVGSSYLGNPEIAIHNTILQCFYFLGAFGILLLLILALLYLKESKNFKKVDWYSIFIPLGIMAFMMCGLDNLFSYRLYILVIMLAYSVTKDDAGFSTKMASCELTSEANGDNKEYECELSIIIPVYNAENYIEDCINSILKNLEGYSYEVIAVNDGSTDSSLTKLNTFKGLENVHIINKENGGVSSARNEGLKIAKGKYVTFFDADDVCRENFNNVFADIKSNSDLYTYGVVCNNIISGKTKYVKNQEFSSLSTETMFLNYCENGLTNSVWNKIFKLDIIKKYNLSFKKYTIAEDMLFVVEYVSHINNCVSKNYGYYEYLIRNGSAMTSMKISKIVDGVNASKEAYNCINALSDEKIKWSLGAYVAKNAYYELKMYTRLKNEDEKSEAIKFFAENKDVFREASNLKTQILKFSINLLGVKNTLKLLDLVF